MIVTANPPSIPKAPPFQKCFPAADSADSGEVPEPVPLTLMPNTFP